MPIWTLITFAQKSFFSSASISRFNQENHTEFPKHNRAKKRDRVITITSVVRIAAENRSHGRLTQKEMQVFHAS